MTGDEYRGILAGCHPAGAKRHLRLLVPARYGPRPRNSLTSPGSDLPTTTFWASAGRSTSSSRSSVVRPLLPPLRSARACTTQPRSDEGVKPRSRATTATRFPSSRTRRTARALNSSACSLRLRRPPSCFPSILATVSTFRGVSTGADQAPHRVTDPCGPKISRLAPGPTYARSSFVRTASASPPARPPTRSMRSTASSPASRWVTKRRDRRRMIAPARCFAKLVDPNSARQRHAA